MDEDLPTPPESLPKYLAEGLPRQDDETLGDVRAYVDTLLASRDRAVSPDALPADAETFTPDTLPADIDTELVAAYRSEHPDRPGGHFAIERVTCGADCSCNDGQGHGPYVYHYYYTDGVLRSAYVGKP
jgi:hypothetical protein